MWRLLVSAGGTGGGVYPALAIVRALGGRADVLWVGGEGGMEASLVQRAGVNYTSVPAAGVHGVGWRALPGNLARLARGVRAARAIVRSFRPQAVLFTGGFVGVPVALASTGVPKLAYVPDIEPALALQVVARLSDVVAATTEATQAFLPRKRVVVTGYPTRPELVPMPKDVACGRLGLNPTRPVLLVSGGSRGARSINRAVWGSLDTLLARTQVIHITGELDWPEVEAVRVRLPARLAADYRPYAYLHEEMGPALAAADLVVSRAGASVLGEYPLFGLPAVLVPYPHAWRYQKDNAGYLAERGAALVVDDSAVAQVLASTVLALLDDRPRLATMGEAARRLARPQAAAAIADEIERLVPGRSGSGD